MVNNHLCRNLAPKAWPISIKETKWTIKPSSGPHAIQECIPVGLLLRNTLKLIKTARETRNILQRKLVKVNNKIVHDQKSPLGLFDIIEIENEKPRRLLLDENNKFILVEAKHPNIKPSKVIGKRIMKNKKIQINFSDGKNLILDKDNYSVNDTVLFDLKTNKPLKTLKFEKNAKVYLTGGKHKGLTGTLEETKIQSSKTKFDKISFKHEKKLYETQKDYAFVIDEEII